MIIKAGVQITCTAGHPIAKVKDDIKPGDVISRASFIDWGQDHEGPDHYMICHVCEAPFYASGQSGTALHTENGWISSRPDWDHPMKIGNEYAINGDFRYIPDALPDPRVDYDMEAYAAERA